MPSTSIIIFGGTGDLAQHKLLPALSQVVGSGEVGQKIEIIALGRRSQTREEFIEQLQKASPAQYQQTFLDTLFYYQIDITQVDGYGELDTYISTFEEDCGGCNRLFYLSIPPDLYHPVTKNIHASGLHEQSEGHWRRIVVEKPFGNDLTSARELQRHISELFSEEQIYRIDHYLAKETVQNILAFRFANGIFEPLWSRDHIDHIQITVAEEEGIKNRGPYYDKTGTFRDFVQNHILQLVALLLMDEPAEFNFTELSDQKICCLGSPSFDQKAQ